MTGKVDEITVRWEPDGSINPLRFTWQGQDYTVESVGRSWRADDGYHVLCMVAGNLVFELLLTSDLVWQLYEPAVRRKG
jgi:hypothetical protein